MIKKLAFIFFIVLIAVSASSQVSNLDEAQALARKQNKLILLKFSGSDWCGPCIMIKKTIFDAPEFQSFANDKLILLNADFPRQKKNQLSKEQQELNDRLAEKYNPQGLFPFLALTDADGEVLYQWDGYNKKLAVSDYIEVINRYSK